MHSLGESRPSLPSALPNVSRRCASGRKVLPDRLFREVQRYVSGLVWISSPERRRLKRAGDDAKHALIRQLRKDGLSFREISRYPGILLSAPQICRIVHASCDRVSGADVTRGASTSFSKPAKRGETVDRSTRSGNPGTPHFNPRADISSWTSSRPSIGGTR